jgi:hypothetical protein
MNVTREKHLSIYKIPLRHKQVKREQEVRRFKKASSVFAKWKEDHPALLKLCYDSDMKETKLPRFIREEGELAGTLKVIRDNYGILKNQFTSLIADRKSFPDIEWLAFVNQCSAGWKLLDKELLT